MLRICDCFPNSFSNSKGSCSLWIQCSPAAGWNSCCQYAKPDKWLCTGT